MSHPSSILIVDDDATGRETLRLLLEPQGHTLLTASNGREALALAAAEPPDLILLDVMMPEMDGYEVCRRLRADPVLGEVPIIMVTALDDRESRLRAIEAGADDFLSKPYNRDELRARVKAIVRLNRYRRLMSERARFERVFELAPNGLFMLDAAGQILLLNPAARNLLGLADDEQIIETEVWRFIAPEVAELFATRLRSLFDGPGQIARFESIMVRMDGRPIAVEVDAGYIEWMGSRAAQVSIRDISERRQSEARVQQQLDRLNALRAIDVAITSSMDLHVTLRIVLDHVVSYLHVDAAAILLRRPNTHELEYTLASGTRRTMFRPASMLIGEGYAGRVALERRLVHGSELRHLSVQPPLGEQYPGYYGIALIVKGQVEGVLEVFRRKDISPDEDWCALLETMASQAALAIDNASLVNSLQRANIELSQAYTSTLEGWARALELRDKETEGHAQRVTGMTLRLSQLMGIGETDLVHVRRGALLHDIGKMGIPDSILLKPGKLTEEEWVIMRQHPVYAYNLLAPIAFLRPALDIPHYHHERWDGTGYPKGLKGEEIPLSARIFAVVDVWDALRFDRPYRSGWPDERVNAYLHDGAGIQFDPEVVKKFLELQTTEQAEARVSILIVDDEPQQAALLRRLLSDVYNVFTASSGQEALNILQQEAIAVVISDQRMPGMTGVQLMEQMRRISPNTLGILSSGYSEAHVLSAALNLGTVRGFIPKPWADTEVRKRVYEAVQQHLAGKGDKASS